MNIEMQDLKQKYIKQKELNDILLNNIEQNANSNNLKIKA